MFDSLEKELLKKIELLLGYDIIFRDWIQSFGPASIR